MLQQLFGVNNTGEKHVIPDMDYIFLPSPVLQVYKFSCDQAWTKMGTTWVLVSHEFFLLHYPTIHSVLYSVLNGLQGCTTLLGTFLSDFVTTPRVASIFFIVQ